MMATISEKKGFLYDPFDSDVLSDPYPYYHRLRKEFPVYHNVSRDFWTLSRFTDVQAAARNWQGLSSASGVELDDTQTFYPETFGPGNVVITDPPAHKRIRRVAQPHFAPQAIQTFEPEIRNIVSQLLDELEASDAPDLARDFAWRIPVATVSHILGFPRHDRGFLAKLIFEFETREPDAGQDDYFDIPAAARKAGATLAQYIAEQLDRRRDAPGEDLLSGLVQAERDGQLAPDEARGLTFILVMAGIDTTACLISNALQRLEVLPDERNRIARDADFARQAIEELVRFEAPVQGEARVAVEDITICGSVIPTGARVWLCFGAANRDEKRFERPDDLDFSREVKRHLGFGEGIHHCIGAPLARLEGRIALEEFCRRVRAYSLTGQAQRLNQHTTRGWRHLMAALR